MSKKLYVIDTSVIIDNPYMNLLKLSQNNSNTLIITETILSELDKHKISLRTDVKFAAKAFFRSMKNSKFKKTKELTAKKQDNIYKVNLAFKELNSELDLFVVVRNKYKQSTLNEESVNDAKIREVAKSYKATCITNDTSFKAIAMSQGIKAEALHWNSLKNPEKLSFYKEYVIFEEDKERVIEEIKKSQKKWNQICLKFKEKEGEQVYETNREEHYLVNGEDLLLLDFESFKGIITPINSEQKYYSKILENNPPIAVVTGATGSGKTLIAMQEAMKKVKDPNNEINGIVYMRYTVNAEDKFSALGYRKGDEQTKLGYFNYPLYGALNFMAEQQLQPKKEKKPTANNQRGENNSKDSIQAQKQKEDILTIKKNEITEKMIAEYNIEVIDIAHARGITITNKIIIFDEIQNCPNQILQLIGTRVGKHSQIIFMGDYNQVDHPYLTKERNGLITMLKLAEKDNTVAAIQLKHTVRSPIAEWFQENIKG